MSVHPTYCITCTDPDDQYLEGEPTGLDTGAVLWHIDLNLDRTAIIRQAPGMPGVHADAIAVKALLHVLLAGNAPDEVTARHLDRAGISVEWLRFWSNFEVPEVGQRKGLYERLTLSHTEHSPAPGQGGQVRVARYGVESLRVGLAAAEEFFARLVEFPGGRKPERQAMDLLGMVTAIPASVGWTEPEEQPPTPQGASRSV